MYAFLLTKAGFFPINNRDTKKKWLEFMLKASGKRKLHPTFNYKIVNFTPRSFLQKIPFNLLL